MGDAASTRPEESNMPVSFCESNVLWLPNAARLHVLLSDALCQSQVSIYWTSSPAIFTTVRDRDRGWGLWGWGGGRRRGGEGV